MKMKDERVEKYAREVADICPAKNKRKVREMISLQVMDFLAENPDAGMDDIYMTFGTPRSFAEDYLSTFSTGELCSTVKKSFTYKRITACVLVFAFIAMAALGVVGFQFAADRAKSEQIVYECKVDGIDIAVTVVATNGDEMSDEEFAANIPVLIEQLKSKYGIED